MIMRITKEDLEAMEERVNELLRRIKLRISYRYNYVAIDIEQNGRIFDTLLAGLTKKEAYDMLYAIERVIELERWI